MRTTRIKPNDIYKIQPDVWIVRSMTNDDVEYSVRKKDSTNELDITSYICTCRDFKAQQLPCKHIFAVLNQCICNNNNIEVNQESECIEPNNSPSHVIFVDQENIERNDNKDVKMLKLQNDLAIIITKWKNKRGRDIQSLRKAFNQTAQIERARIARLESVPQVNDNNKLIISQITPNI